MEEQNTDEVIVTENQNSHKKIAGFIVAALLIGFVCGVFAMMILGREESQKNDTVLPTATAEFDATMSPVPTAIFSTLATAPTSVPAPSKSNNQKDPFGDCSTDSNCPAGWICKESGSCAHYDRPAPITPSI